MRKTNMPDDRMINRCVVLRRRPVGVPVADDFMITDAPLTKPAEGELTVRNRFISLDPGLRQRLSQVDSYVKLIDIGGLLTTTTLGEVIASRHSDYAVGDAVVGFNTISEYSTGAPGPMTRKVDLARTASPTNHLSVLGPTGMTAYFGMLDIGRPQAGETVLVSAASGAVGSVAGQIARIKGCRTVGIAGGAEKCRRLVEEFSFDAAIDYHGKDLAAITTAIREACPDGVDIFFDNVGGIQLDAALDCLNPGGRVALCGLIAQYNASEPPIMTNLFKLIAKSARIEGFLMSNYADRFTDALDEMAGWINDGRLVFREQFEDGLDNAVRGFLRLFDGSNAGKMIVRMPD